MAFFSSVGFLLLESIYAINFVYYERLGFKEELVTDALY